MSVDSCLWSHVCGLMMSVDSCLWSHVCGFMSVVSGTGHRGGLLVQVFCQASFGGFLVDGWEVLAGFLHYFDYLVE